MLAVLFTSVAPALLVGPGSTRIGTARVSRAVTRMDAVELPPTLIEWGCDEALWSEIRDKQALLDMASAGNEDKARKRIEFVKAAVAKGSGIKGGWSQMGKVDRNRPYELKGAAPEGADVEAITAILAQRVEFKKVRDFEQADVLQAQLLEMGVYVNDKQRTWETAKAPNGGYTLTGAAPDGVDVDAVNAILAKRRDAKKAKDFASADEMQAELSAMGVWVDDKKRTWSAMK